MRTSLRGAEIPAFLLRLANFRDSSYGNDENDSVVFTIGAVAYCLWINAAEPSRYPGEFAAYQLVRLDNLDTVEETLDARDFAEEILETDDLVELQNTITKLLSEAGH